MLGASAGTQPRKLTRALGKSNDQNSSPYRVLRPHWQDLKASDLKQHCASVYTGTCQAHVKVYRGSVNRWTRKWRSTHLTQRLEENTFYYWKCGANLGVLAIARPHMHRTHVLLLKCHENIISSLFPGALFLDSSARIACPSDQVVEFPITRPTTIRCSVLRLCSQHRQAHDLNISAQARRVCPRPRATRVCEWWVQLY